MRPPASVPERPPDPPAHPRAGTARSGSVPGRSRTAPGSVAHSPIRPARRQRRPGPDAVSRWCPRFRYANALTNLFDYPIWLLCGLLVPVELLPAPVRPLAWLLPPTWGAQAIRDSVIGGAPPGAVGACLALGAGYLVLSLFTIRTFELLARRGASLALA